MATMDIVKLAGGEPANFLDVGGGASPEQIENAFRILSSDPRVKAVFINVFGGILRCDRLAEGVIAAVRTLGLRLPVVVRMEGTNVELGKKMLAESGLALTTADDMGDGARKVVALARGRRVSVLVDRTHARGRAGDHRARGRLPRRAVPRVRHHRGGRRHARARAARPTRASPCGTRWRRRSSSGGRRTAP